MNNIRMHWEQTTLDETVANIQKELEGQQKKQNYYMCKHFLLWP